MKRSGLIRVCFIIVAFTVFINGQNDFFDLWTFNFFGYQDMYDYETYALRLNSVNQYWLYTRQNPDIGIRLVTYDAKSFEYSTLDVSKVTVFLVHGWTGYYTDELNVNITRALLLSSDVNVICIDWSEYSKLNYFSSANAVPKIGTDLGDFVSWLVSLGVDYNKVHLAGHSLGAHIVGFAGRRTGGKVRRITGMDPAGPIWSNRKHLTADDAQYVECIHTSAKLLGTAKVCGQADFYPNGGTFMPGCGVSMICSHFKAFYYFSASVLYPDKFVGYKCETVDDAMKSNCNGETAVMGNADVDKNVTGIYYLKTRDVYPFC